MNNKIDKLGPFLREVSNWDWEQFCRAEHDDSYTSNEAIIFALIRSAVMERMDAIRLSLGRLDGKLVTPIKVVYPKIYFLFPNASALKAPVDESLALGESQPNDEECQIVVYEPEVLEPEEDEPKHDIEALSLRETLSTMSAYSRKMPQQIIQLAMLTEQWLNNQAPKPSEVPRVKSVVAAHLLQMAQKRDIGALTEVFDQLDGKLVETFQVLGDDIFITNYSTFAPPGAELNKDGVLQMEAEAARDLWAQKLRKD